MGIADFLFQGSTPVTAPTGSDTSTSFPLWLQQANYNLAGAAANLGSTPYTPFPGQQVYSPSSQTQQGWNLAGQQVGAWQPALENAGALTQAAATPINSGDINRYLDPYAEDVVGGLEGASNYNLFHNVLPGVQDKFVSAGQSRSPQEMEMTNNAIYNSQTALNPAISQALSTGYQGALTSALGQKAQQQSAAAQYGQLGALSSQLGAYDVAALGNAGQQQDALSQANINASMQNFQNQVQWPFLTLGYASDITRGLQVPTSSQTVQSSFAPASGPSPVSTALGTAALAQSLNLARGGHVRGALTGYAAGGRHLGETLTPGDAGPDQWGNGTLAPTWWTGAPQRTIDNYERLMPRDPRAEDEVSRIQHDLTHSQVEPHTRMDNYADGGTVPGYDDGGSVLFHNTPTYPAAPDNSGNLGALATYIPDLGQTPGPDGLPSPSSVPQLQPLSFHTRRTPGNNLWNTAQPIDSPDAAGLPQTWPNAGPYPRLPGGGALSAGNTAPSAPPVLRDISSGFVRPGASSQGVVAAPSGYQPPPPMPTYTPAAAPPPPAPPAAAPAPAATEPSPSDYPQFGVINDPVTQGFYDSYGGPSGGIYFNPGGYSGNGQNGFAAGGTVRRRRRARGGALTAAT